MEPKAIKEIDTSEYPVNQLCNNCTALLAKKSQYGIFLYLEALSAGLSTWKARATAKANTITAHQYSKTIFCALVPLPHLTLCAFNNAKMAIDKTVTEPGLADVLTISNQARDQAITLVRLLQEAAADTTPAGPDSERAIELDKHEKLLFTNTAQLRGLHRAACFSARDTKATTAEARQELDRLHLQLQNLYYEQRHLQGEIEACESYK